MAQATKKKPVTKAAAPKKRTATKKVTVTKPASQEYSQSVIAMAAAFAGLCVAFALFAILGR